MRTQEILPVNAPPMFVPLHVKSDYSLGYGTASVDELVDRAVMLGYPALALTDIENLYGQVRFHHQCRLRGIRPVTGLELRPGFDGRRNVGRRAGRVVLLAMDEAGYRSLCRIVSHRRGALRERTKEDVARDPVPLVMRHPEGLFVLSDDPAVIERLVACGSFARERLGLFLVRPEKDDAESHCLEAATRPGVRLVADLDAVFLREEDCQLHALQLAIRQGRRLSEAADDDVESRERWLRPKGQLSLRICPRQLPPPLKIAEACRLDLGAVEGASPAFELPGEENAAAAPTLRGGGG